MTVATGQVLHSEALAVRSDGDVVRVRQAVRTLAQTAKLSLVDQTKLVTAASEIARNTLVHGGGGSAVLQVVADPRAVSADRRNTRGVRESRWFGVVRGRRRRRRSARSSPG